jgi:predicted MFS family arabinose efflux permease
MMTGDLIAGRFFSPRTRERLAVPMVALIGAPLAGLGFAPPLPAVLALLFVSGNGFGYALALQHHFREAVPPSLHGQAFTLMSTGLMTLQGLGPVASGILAERVGPTVTIAVAGLATIATAPLARAGQGSAGSRRSRTDVLGS